MREGMPHTDEALIDFARWLEERGHAADGAAARDMAERSGIGLVRELAGPVGETNLYGLNRAAACFSCRKRTRACGGFWRRRSPPATRRWWMGTRASQPFPTCRRAVAARVSYASDWAKAGPFAGALIEGNAARVRPGVNARIAALDGPLVLVQAATGEALRGRSGGDLPELAGRGGVDLGQHGGGRRQCQPDDDRLTKKAGGDAFGPSYPASTNDGRLQPIFSEA